MKRMTDIMLSLTLMVLLSPILVATMLVILSSSGKPIFFRQTRVGLYGREFGMFKFRSMVINAASTGPYFTQDDDPRITRVGRFIRRTSIDELPQIINVVIGDMSLVGPRPDVPEQQALYSPEDWAQRCSVRPGITGLAQVKGRSELAWALRLELDLTYASQASWWLDVKIMWWTLSQLGGRQAN